MLKSSILNKVLFSISIIVMLCFAGDLAAKSLGNTDEKIQVVIQKKSQRYK